ncbi:MAG: hypothetical protein H7293_03275 [Candidatus Saccharibacteria bacterium]|nr:hypothetical protein [Rhodoferax sp.]
MKIKTATGPIALYMRAFGFKGWASFWDTIYLAPGYETNAGLIRHESKHIEQIARDGRLRFSVQYLWWNCTRGYWNNPYENEAREAQYSV